jgi:predicted O-methyltransferase YrrM
VPAELTWQSEERCTVGGTVFQTLPVQLFEGEAEVSMEGADFWLFKERPLVERYAELVEELRPRHIFELGIYQGGSTVLLFELARPAVLVAIDQRPPRGDALADYLSRMKLGPALRIHDDVDQADRPRLAQITDEAFDDEPLDLVTDDCSHLYEPSKTSFNELFPRLRPGGVYVIEDWRWAHGVLDSAGAEGLYPEEVPLTRLLFEILLALPSVPGLISEVTTTLGAVEVRRGDAEIDPRAFDISACLTPRSRRMLGD